MLRGPVERYYIINTKFEYRHCRQGFPEGLGLDSRDAALIEKIHNLKSDQKAVILAHNCQLPEVQDIADFVGDSWEI